MSVGYCVGIARSPSPPASTYRATEHQVGRQEIRERNLAALAAFLPHYSPSRRQKPAQEKESAPLLDIWRSLPDAVKQRIFEESKRALEHTVKDGYQSLKDQSNGLYEEMRYFVNKKINGEGQ